MRLVRTGGWCWRHRDDARRSLKRSARVYLRCERANVYLIKRLCVPINISPESLHTNTHTRIHTLVAIKTQRVVGSAPCQITWWGHLLTNVYGGKQGHSQISCIVTRLTSRVCRHTYKGDLLNIVIFCRRILFVKVWSSITGYQISSFFYRIWWNP